MHKLLKNKCRFSKISISKIELTGYRCDNKLQMLFYLNIPNSENTQVTKNKPIKSCSAGFRLYTPIYSTNICARELVIT